MSKVSRKKKEKKDLLKEISEKQNHDELELMNLNNLEEQLLENKKILEQKIKNSILNTILGDDKRFFKEMQKRINSIVIENQSFKRDNKNIKKSNWKYRY